MADKPNNNHFGEAMKRRREVAGLTQAELAEHAGVSVSTISHWEHRELAPRTWAYTLFKVDKSLKDASNQRDDLNKRREPAKKQRVNKRKACDLSAFQEYGERLEYLLGDAWNELSIEAKESILNYMEFSLLKARGALTFERIMSQLSAP